jgi:6-phosphogluconolactonase (cycloisomerase 2 family)
MATAGLRRLLVPLLAAVACLLLCVSGASASAPVFTQAPGSPYNINADVTADAVAYSPSGALFAVGDGFAPGVAIFDVTPSTGALTEVGTPVSAGADVEDVAFSPSGDLLATTEQGGAVVMYSVDQATGSLSAWTPVPMGCGQTAIAFNPSGNSIAVTSNCNANSSDIQVFSVNRSQQTLSSIGTVTTGQCPQAPQYSRSSALLALVSECSAGPDVELFSVDPSTGMLTSLMTTPTAGPSSCSAGIAFSPNANLLAATSICDTPLQIFSVNKTTGALNSVATPAVDGCPSSPDFSPSGGLLEVTNGCDQQVGVFSVSSDGSTVSAVSGSPYTPNPSQNAHPDGATFSPGGGTLAVANGFVGNISVLTVAPPTATISSPGTGRVYAVGQQVPTAFSCADDGAYGSGISTCTDSNSASGGAGKLNTSTLGAHRYTVTATSKDELGSQTGLAYTVVGAPTATISLPASGHRYEVGKRVAAAFSCAEAAGGPGLVTCVDSNGSTSGSGSLSTHTPGRHTYTVTAFSEDGARTTTSITYTVAARPTITIKRPAKGADYSQGQKVKVRFKCHDGRGGPGIAKCTGTVRSGGRLDTSTPGKRRFTVKAKSEDGQSARYSVVYRVV